MSAQAPLVDLIVPVLNEAHVLEHSVGKLREFLSTRFPYPWRITIVDNGSRDGTGEIGRRLARQFPEVRCHVLEQRGRGRALRYAWLHSEADIMAYTDVDLSTELEALEVLCRAIHEEGFDLGTGSRLLPQSRTRRKAKREIISRIYNWMVRILLRTRFSDAQCGFKAVSREVAQTIIPEVVDEHWFFDTELLTLCEKRGYRIKDHPVRWDEDDDSRVKIVSTAWEDIKGILRLRRYLWSRAFRERAAAPAAHAVAKPRTGSDLHV